MGKRTSIEIPIQPWFRDHCFNGKVILAAVEIMEILTAAVQGMGLAIHPGVIEEAGFSKFLEIPDGATELSALVEYEEGDGGALQVKLLSRVQFKKISRIKEHARLTLLTLPPAATDAYSSLQRTPVQPLISVEAERIYEELVPFGPTYRTLTGTLQLSEKGAWGTLQAPLLDEEKQVSKLLGSPFPLDGAMHAACVFGQCLADFVPFPVGFARRTIHHPTQAGEHYSTTVLPVSLLQDQLIFDLAIFNDAGDL